MEVSDIDTISSVKKIQKKSEMQAAKMESLEAKKRAEWVAKLKEMPDIRQEKIEKAMHSAALSQPTAYFLKVAHHILKESNFS